MKRYVKTRLEIPAIIQFLNKKIDCKILSINEHIKNWKQNKK